MNTGIPDPLAYLELLIINEALPPNLGQCLGFSLSSARLSLADFIPNDFPIQPGTDGSTVWDLNGPAGPSPELRDFIHQAHLEQTTVEFLTNYVGQIAADETLGLGVLIDRVKSELAQGRPVVIPFQEGGFGGHAVLAYNVEDLPNGGETARRLRSQRPVPGGRGRREPVDDRAGAPGRPSPLRPRGRQHDRL